MFIFQVYDFAEVVASVTCFTSSAASSTPSAASHNSSPEFTSCSSCRSFNSDQTFGREHGYVITVVAVVVVAAAVAVAVEFAEVVANLSIWINTGAKLYYC